MNEVIFEEREDLMDDLAEVEADEQWYADMDANDDYINEQVRNWEIGHCELEAWDL